MTRQRKGKSGTPGNYARQVRWAIGRCAACQKDIFLSRANARRAARELPPSAGPAGEKPNRPRAYPCPHTDGHWHIGHVPQTVRRGGYSKQAWKRRKTHDED